ncbi:MAG: hypothetical protein WC205_05290 [Opitutaceae bacterium]|jgi:hypothetical protein
MPRQRRAGFALLITITLLAFLVLLLVSLASLTRVETRVASNNQTLSQARQNALFALNVALGQLQKYSGPDQRVTALADITTVDDKLTRNAAGEPVVNDVKNALWTGVWDSSKWNPLTGAYDGSPRARTRPEPMTWLVSGNEDVAAPRKYAPKNALPASSATTPKQVLVNGVAADGSVDTANPRVEVPVVEIKSATVPGLPGDKTVGHYAWWVGDEGVKARISTVAPAVVADQAKPATPAGTGAAFYYWKVMAPARAGGELMTGPGGAVRVFPDFDDLFATTTAGQTLRTSFGQVIAPHQLALLPAGAGGGAISPDIELRKNAPAFTTVSRGVLADTVHGGLRLDLTRYLETGNTDGAFNATDSIYADAALTGARQPAFSLLKSWYDTGRGLTGGGFAATAAIQPETTSGNVITGQGIFPVITRYQIALAAMSEGPGSPLMLVVHPSVTLWNPHNVSIGPEDLVLEIDENSDFRFIAEADDGAGGAHQYITRDADGGGARKSLGNMGLGYPAVFRMRIPQVRFEPGQALVFSLKGNGTVPSTEVAAPEGTATSGFPLMVPQWNDRSFLIADTGLVLDSTPLAPGKYINLSITSGVPSNFRFRARLYRESDHPAGVKLQTIEHPFNEGIDVKVTFKLLATPPTDSTAFRSNVAAMRLPYSNKGNVSSGTATNAPAVPFAQFNVRGAFGVNTSFEKSTESLAGDPFFASYRESSLAQMPLEVGPDGDLGFGGPSEIARLGAGGSNQGNYFILFDYPRPETAVDGNSGRPALVSLGEFQHADLSSNALQPTYVFGNSWPDPRLGRESIAGKWSGYPAAIPQQSVFSGNDYLLRDASYLANHALWDRFFLSTIPQQTANTAFDGGVVLPNVRLHPVPGMITGKSGYPDFNDVRNTRAAAGSLLLEGAFNINSTSVDAWRALLGGLADLTVPTAGWSQGGSVPPGATANPAGRGLRHNYSRFLLPRGDAFDQTDSSFGAGNTNGTLSRAAWTGHRYLTDAEIDTLARNIVEEVKVRGPFMSLADFVNRRLITAAADDSLSVTNDLEKHRLKTGTLGALQKAILNLSDVSRGLNAALNQPAMASTDFSYTGGSAKVFRNGAPNSVGFRNLPAYPSQVELLNGGLLGQLSYGAPGFLTQADVLQKIGPVIAARSDTFVVRTYGDATNPATGDVDGRAWCEAVVQRLPEFVDPAQAPETVITSLNPTNRDFGRRYRVVSFRWLTPADL